MKRVRGRVRLEGHTRGPSKLGWNRREGGAGLQRTEGETEEWRDRSLGPVAVPFRNAGRTERSLRCSETASGRAKPSIQTRLARRHLSRRRPLGARPRTDARPGRGRGGGRVATGEGGRGAARADRPICLTSWSDDHHGGEKMDGKLPCRDGKIRRV